MTFSELLNRITGIFRWWIVVAPWERAVRVRMGKNAAELGPGIHLRIPGLDRYYRESIRLRTIDTGLQTVATRDGKTVTLRGMIRFRIADYLRVFEELHHAEDTLIDLAMSEIAQQVRTRMASSLTPEDLEARVTDRLNGGRYGLEQVAVSLTDFAFVRTYRLMMYDARWQRGDNMSYGEITKGGGL